MHASAHGHSRVGLQALSADSQAYLPADLAGLFALRFTVLRQEQMQWRTSYLHSHKC